MVNLTVIKRNDSEQAFSVDKIANAIRCANESTSDVVMYKNEKIRGKILSEDDNVIEFMTYDGHSVTMDKSDVRERAKDKLITGESMDKIINTVKKSLEGFTTINVEDIQDLVEKALVRHNKYVVAKAYILYRQRKKETKKFTENEEKVLSLVGGVSDLRGDNANKNIDDNGAMRDYFAGILSKSLTSKLLPKDINEAHKKGIIHFHDADYHANPMHNCDLIDVDNMFTYGFQMQNTMVEPNKKTPFRTICNLLAQINLIVSGRQYGGQTVSWSHLLPYINNSRVIIKENLTKLFEELNYTCDSKVMDTLVERKLREEIAEGVKTYQYQVLCHSSSNGQTPFVSNNLCLAEAETEQELEDFAMLIEEILKRRITGVKDGSGHFISPLFPKLLYWTIDGVNLKKGDKYFYLTELAAECIAIRMQPDIVSESQTRKVKKGQIIPSMGCRSLLSPIWEENEYPVDTKFYWVKKEDTFGVEYDGNLQYPYGKFVAKRDFLSLENGKYEKNEYCINFRGNTGWLIEKTDDKVVILQPKVYGRWNNGVVTLNLPYVALEARQAEPDNVEKRIEKFYEILSERCELCRKALKVRYEHCSNIKGKNSAILWVYGALARMNPNETVGDLMKKYPQRASISLGYVGLYETCRALIGESNTTENGKKLSVDVLTKMNEICAGWAIEDKINYAIYGTPEESLTKKFALANRRDFGYIEYITDKDYVVNSYHVDPREKIDAFSKIVIEGKYLALSSGGAVSYCEVNNNIVKNIKAIVSIIQWMSEHIVYAEINRKLGICYNCDYEGDIQLYKTEDGKFKFKCPICGNEDDSKMDITARLCGYIGKVNAGNTNTGRLDDIYNRVIHTDCKDEIQ